MRYLIAACVLFTISLLILVNANAEIGDGFNGVTFKPVLGYKTVDTSYTGWNKAWLTAAIAGQVADVASTAIAIGNGAEESNPIYGKEPNYLVLFLVKGALIGGSYLLIEYVAEPADRQNLRNWCYGSLAVIGGGAMAWNLSQ